MVTSLAAQTVVAKEGLLDIFDEVNRAKHYAGCLTLACSSPRFASADRAALCAVGDAVRDKLEAIAAALDQLVRAPQPDPAADEA